MVRNLRWLGIGWLFAPSVAWAAAVPLSGEIPITTAASGARWVHAVDLDRDGDLDAVSASFDDATIAWYENDGSAGFTVHAIATDALGARVAYARDVDGDGDVDVLSASASDDTIAWYENDGEQSFTKHAITSTADGAASVWATDLDRDGDLDVLAASESDDTVAWYENDGAEAFAEHTIDSSAAGAVAVYAADLDGDGDDDVLCASADDDTVAWYENQLDESAAAFGPRRVISATAGGARSVHAADLDRDGDLDVVAASADDDTIAWFANRLDESSADFGPPSIVSQTAAGADRVDTVDLDRDGDLDVLAASAVAGTIAWYENDGAQGFDEHPISNVAPLARGVFAADVDGDGDLDVLSASEADDRVAWHRNESIHSTAVFGERIEISTQALGARWVAAADVDRDGDMDVLSASHDDSKIAWYENDGAQAFTEHVVGTDEYQARSVEARDMDNDGDVDILSAAITDDVVVWENNGAQQFTRRIVTVFGLGHRAAWAADFDNDGDQDVLAIVEASDRVEWHENDGTLGFTPHVITTLADSVRAAYPADLDGDGDLDVLSASNDDNKIAWYENRVNQPSHDFGPQRIITTALSQARAVFAADVDGDGDLDALSGSVFDRRVAWYANRLREQSADFGPMQTISLDAYLADNVHAADLDFDGDTDVFSASVLGEKISWYENDGQQGFVEHVMGHDIWSHCVLTADLDTDGDTDILMASEFDDRIAWYENRGGPYGLTTTAPALGPACNGDQLLLLRVSVKHQGRAGDSAEELSRLEIELLEAPGDPLTASEANALIAELSVFRDDGSGALNGADVEVATVDTLAPLNGVQSIVLPDGAPGAQVPTGATGLFFVVARIAAGALGAVPNSFRAVHLASATVVEDAAHDVSLRVPGTQTVSTATITVTCSCAGGDADGDTFACDVDCDDGNAAVNPGATEIACDAIDNDCSAATADAVDGDGDTFACDVDCDDASAAVNPGATEIACDAIDNDCSAATPDAVDGDGDTFACDVDCDDGNAAVNPGATEIACDAIDNDCSAATPDTVDGDGDTFACDVDCDDASAAVYPGAPEIGCDAIDNDCSAATPDAVDADGDTFACDVDCNDASAAVYPGAPEIGCDAIDNDCNTATPDVLDADLDAYACDIDCNDASAAVWGRPGEVPGLSILADRVTVVWSVPAEPGALAGALTYDAIRSGDPAHFETLGTCIATGGSALSGVDSDLPLGDDAFFYLVRALNACPDGVGTLGFSSSGTERSAPACP